MVRQFRPEIITIIVLIVCLCTPPPTPAWSHKGHVIITRMAVKLIVNDPQAPPQLKNLLIIGLGNKQKLVDLESYVTSSNNDERLDEGLDNFSSRPDQLVALKSSIPALEATEELMHYLNLEAFQDQPSRQKFALDGSSKPTIAQLPDNFRDPRYHKAGMITFRTRQSYQSLVASLSQNYSDEQVFLWLGYLSHYLSDAHQPYHSTANYLGYECGANDEHKANHNFHHDLEGSLFEDTTQQGQQYRQQFWRAYTQSLLTQSVPNFNSHLDPYRVTQEALLSGYDYIPLLCHAADASITNNHFDLAVWFNYRENFHNQNISVLDIKAQRMALATLYLKALILQAWQESQERSTIPFKLK